MNAINTADYTWILYKTVILKMIFMTENGMFPATVWPCTLKTCEMIGAMGSETSSLSHTICRGKKTLCQEITLQKPKLLCCEVTMYAYIKINILPHIGLCATRKSVQFECIWNDEKGWMNKYILNLIMIKFKSHWPRI